MTDRRAALDRLYADLGMLGKLVGGPRTLATCSGRSGWPQRGVYFFFEPGEVREDGVTPRVVRVGTHALRPSSSTLWSRLSQHRGNTGGANPGGGNHRGSIFRLHVGTALLASAEWDDGIHATWGDKSTAPREVRTAEAPLEAAVSVYIGKMPLLWLAVDDEPGASSERGVIERGSISLLSNLGREAIDPPSPMWLGHSAARPAIRGSGLWNVNHVAEAADERFLEVLERWIETSR